MSDSIPGNFKVKYEFPPIPKKISGGNYVIYQLRDTTLSRNDKRDIAEKLAKESGSYILKHLGFYLIPNNKTLVNEIQERFGVAPVNFQIAFLHMLVTSEHVMSMVQQFFTSSLNSMQAEVNRHITRDIAKRLGHTLSDLSADEAAIVASFPRELLKKLAKQRPDFIKDLAESLEDNVDEKLKMAREIADRD